LGRLQFEASLGKKFVSPHLQKSRVKWTGSVAQAVERLLCKCKALSSNFSPTLKKSTMKLELFKEYIKEIEKI
jgi:hypothetical protein